MGCCRDLCLDRFYLFCVNDIVEFIQSELEIFADDIKIYSVIETIPDIAKLQQDLWNNYTGLLCIMALEFKFEKCKIMHIGNTPLWPLCDSIR